MGVNVGYYRDEALSDLLSQGKNPGDAGYNPVYNPDTFNGTDGEGITKTVFAHEDNQTKDLFYTAVQARWIEAVAGSRDTDNDATDEVHGYVSPPTESIRAESQVATGDGVETEFFIGKKFVKPGTLIVKLGATVQTPNVDYFPTHLTGWVKFAVAPPNATAINASWTDGDDGAGNVNVPSNPTMEAQQDFNLDNIWDLPHGEDNNRATGHEKDGVPVCVRVVMDAGTTDPDGDAVTVTGIDLQFRGTETAGKYS